MNTTDMIQNTGARRRRAVAALVACAAMASQLLMLLSGCSAEGGAPDVPHVPGGGVAVSFSIDVQGTAAPATRAGASAGTGTGTQLAVGDRFYAYFPANVNMHHAYYDVTSREGDTHNTCEVADATPVAVGDAQVMAYYPQTVTEQTRSFSVKQDQTGDAAYKLSDLMYAHGKISLTTGLATSQKNTGDPDAAAIPDGRLRFYHQMSRLVVQVSSQTAAITAIDCIGGYRTVAFNVEESNAARYWGQLDLWNGAVKGLSDANSTATPLKVFSGTHPAGTTTTNVAFLLPPQTLAGNVLRVTTEGGAQYILPLTQPLVLLAGRQYTLTADLTSLSLTATIGDWGAGTDPTYQESDRNLYEVTSTSDPTKKVTFRMVPVAGGTPNLTAIDYSSNPTTSNVYTANTTLADYYMGEYEVTQELYEAVIGTNPSNSTTTDDGRKPVNLVTVANINSFLAALNTATATQRPAGYSFALPTFDQWIWAATGGTQSHGYTYAGSDDKSAVCVSGGSPLNLSYIATVGSKAPNELGLYDMSGNIFERVNTNSKTSGKGLIACGGSAPYSDYADLSKCVSDTHTDDQSFADWGFRLALVATGGASFGYTGAPQTFTATTAGYYLLEVWGAQGGYNPSAVRQGGPSRLPVPGSGAYVSGYVNLAAGTTLNIYVGGTPTTRDAGFNGGGTAGTSTPSGGGQFGGGGATDIRQGGTALTDRIIVAGGGGGVSYYGNSDQALGTQAPADGGNAGLLGGTGGSGGIAALDNHNETVKRNAAINGLANSVAATGGGQSEGGKGYQKWADSSEGSSGNDGASGQGGNASDSWGGGGGGGYYGGGGGGWSWQVVGSGGGGSSWADPAKVLRPTSRLAGLSGSGRARITYIGASLP